MPTRDLQHARVHVETRHRAAVTDALGGEPCDDAGTAGDVQHALTRAQRGDFDEVLRDRSADAGHEIALIVLGTATTVLVRSVGLL
jgi:hypothetical protein